MHIGGGEPFLRPEGLYEVLEAAVEADVCVEYVETNSSWFCASDRTDTILQEIKARGVDTLLLSISPFHNASVPFCKVAGLMRACEVNGVGVFPWTMEMLPEVQSLDPGTTHSLDEYRERFGDRFIPDAMNRYGVVPGGTALKTLAPYMAKRSIEVLLRGPSPCSRLMRTTHFHVDLFGNYVPCLCPGLSIRLEDLADELDADRYPILNALVRDGVRGLLDLAVTEHGFAPSPDGYTLPCELCHIIRAHLALGGAFPSPELQPVEFYE